MTVSGFIYQRVPAEEGGSFCCPPGHSVAAAPTEYFAPQRIGPGILLGALEPGPLGLHLVEQLPADNRLMMVGNLDPLAFILHPYPVPAHLRHFPLAYDVSSGIAFIVQDMHH